VKSYQYDSINCLVSEAENCQSQIVNRQYSHDLAGNRTSVTADGGGDPGSTNVYTLGTGDRLAGVSGASSSVAFGYDIAGNTTNIPTGTNTLALSWNEKYQLTSVSSVSSVVNYSYDVLGRRTSRFVVPPSGGSTNTEHYIYNGNQVVADLDASGNMLRTYTWGPGIDNLLAMTVCGSETNTYYALKDHQNSVLAFTDASGTIVESYEYDAYGNILDMKDCSGSSIANHQSAIGNRYLFQGREIDWDIGLIYFRARWYSPETGRWLSKDPIGISGGLNLYVFCGNNPVNFIDPFGWVDLFPNSPVDVVVEITTAVSIYQDARSTQPGHNDMRDAARHANTSREVAEKTSLATSLTLGLGNEIKTLVMDRQNPAESKMDMHNNIAGLKSALTGAPVNPSSLATLNSKTGTYSSYSGGGVNGGKK